MAVRARRIVGAVGLVLLGAVSTAAVFMVEARGAAAVDVIECQIRDLVQARTQAEKDAQLVVGREWLSMARVCSVGGFTIVVPPDQTEGHVIFVYRGRKPVLERTRDGAHLFSPTVPDGRFDRVAVNVWHPCDGEITRLYYDTRGAESSISVGDLDFDGTPDVRTRWTHTDIDHAYVWYQGAWHDFKKGTLLVDDRWRRARFADGEWRIQKDGDPQTPSPRTTSPCAPISGSHE